MALPAGAFLRRCLVQFVSPFRFEYDFFLQECHELLSP
jgi:hypothetical protein